MYRLLALFLIFIFIFVFDYICCIVEGARVIRNALPFTVAYVHMTIKPLNLLTIHNTMRSCNDLFKQMTHVLGSQLRRNDLRWLHSPASTEYAWSYSFLTDMKQETYSLSNKASH